MNIALADATQRTFGNDVTTGGGLSLGGACALDVALDRKHNHNGVMTGTGSLVKTNAGAFILGAANHTYSGAITVSGGFLLVDGTLSGGGNLTVETGATLGGSGSVTGHAIIQENGTVNPGNPGVGALTLGSVSLSGAYRCEVDGASADRVDITGALTIEAGASLVFTTLAEPTADEYVIATYGSLTGGPPAILNLPEGYDVDDTTPGVIKLVRAAAGYDAWADSWTEPPLADKEPGADPDNDGISNLLEYILGGDPRAADTGILPTQKIEGEFLVLGYKRNDASELDTTQTGQWSVDLGSWNDIAPVLVNENDDGPDDVEIRIPLSNAVTGKLFGRLKAGK
jgi:autotransporter-associated beta strand protein